MYRNQAIKKPIVINSSSDSDSFDEDDDPDKIEVPGGGKDLATSAAISSLKNEGGILEPVSSATTAVKSPTVINVVPKKEMKLSTTPKLVSVNTETGTNPMNSKPMGMMGMKGFDPGYMSGASGMGPYSNPLSAPGSLGSFGLSPMSYPGMHPGPPNINPLQFLQPSLDRAGGLFPPGFSTSAFNQLLMSANPSATGALLQQILSSGMGMGGMGMTPGWSPFPQMGKNLPYPPFWGSNEDKINALREEQQDDEDAEEDGMGVAETYADYMPAKLKIGKKHPDPVVETASLSSVEPTDIWYQLSIPESTIKSGALSALQLEAITYASQQHEHFLPDGSRAGFLIGDGAGVGKGRTIAGVIYENYMKGRKRAIWVSVSNDLKYDAERDLGDIGAGKIEVHPLNKFKYAKISSNVNGNVKKGVIFSTYSALIGESSQSGGKYKTRLKQLLQWCGDDFDGLIVFDECHRAKNLCPTGSAKPTKTGQTVLELQKKLPKARVIYASATGASEPRNMAYMIRLGIWGEGTPFPEFMDFIGAVEKRGVGAMEIVAMDMKLRGMYIARQLSFQGVTFKVEEVPLSDEFKKIYDDSVALWVEAMQKFTEAGELIDAENRMKKTMWGQFWSAHQRFFKYLCIAAKVKHAVEIAREAVKCGKCVVIGLQSTGEARTLEQLEKDDGELSDFVSTAKGVLQTLVEKHFPAPDRNRVNRLLGMVEGSGVSRKTPKTAKQSNGSLSPDEPSPSSGQKRKPVRQAAARASKRVKEASDSDLDGEEDSDFDMSDEPAVSEMSETDNFSSDNNPFGEDSDSDEPWVNKKTKKKKKKKKQPVKKRQTTQDKLDDIIKRCKVNDRANLQQLNPNVYAPGRAAIERACEMKEELLEKIEELGEKLPPNTLDQLIDELGGPENVAEMTGRKGRVVSTEDGGIQYESRSEVDVPLETLNLTEKQRFMDGEKDIAIISEAASSGISLQSDRRAKNQRRRVHITLELPWSADRAIQQFGRTHRSNQVNAPEYIFMISDLAGERRFASIVAKRLESLGALTHGDRRATETRDLSQYNIDNKYGRSALESTMKTIMGYESPMVPPPKDYSGDFFKDVADALLGVGFIVNSESNPGVLMLDKDYNNMSKFLNRILGLPVELQNRLFKYFTDVLEYIIRQAKRAGRFDLGILDLGAAGDNVKQVKLYKFLRKHATGEATSTLHIVHVERGMSWDDALSKWSELTGSHEGFYISNQVRSGKKHAILAVSVDSTEKSGKKSSKKEKEVPYLLYRPNTGLQVKQETLGELQKKYKKATSDDAQSHWTEQYESAENTCSHAYWGGNCKIVTLGGDCDVGLRRRTYHVLSGSVLSVWSRVEKVLAARSGANVKMQVIRLKTSEGTKIVGTIIPKSCVELLRKDLSEDAEKTCEETF
ncbi:protein strawberry notch isoform X2 [Bemisia tabaci]|uniref:protein strawberry notch isoform X2 n=1 Tax=Bemisia tabaci TaxID=7038 RepID=UPI003B28CD8D